MLRLAQSPTDDAFVQNPYPFYDRARRDGGGDLYFWEDYGIVCAVSHRAVSAGLRDRRTGRAVPDDKRATAKPHMADLDHFERFSMLELEPPDHTRLRGLVLRAFTSRRIEGMAGEIEAIAHGLIDRLPDGDFDLLDGFANLLPVIVISRLLGVPDDMAPQLLRWSNAMVKIYQAGCTHAGEVAANTACQDFRAFLVGYIADRRRAPGDDLISQLLAARDRADRLSEDELITTVILLLNAGHEATVHTLGNGVKALLQWDGDAVAATRTDTVEATIEEVLRFDPPLHLFTRWAYEPFDFFGHQVKPGQEIGLMLGSAGRDPAVWDNPDRFDPSRAPGPHQAFGAGLHFCVGAPLARLEMQIGLRVLFERLPGLRVCEHPRYADLYHFHGLEHLRVSR